MFGSSSANFKLNCADGLFRSSSIPTLFFFLNFFPTKPRFTYLSLACAISHFSDYSGIAVS